MKKSFIRENPFLFHGNAKVQRIAGPIGDADVQKMLRAGEYSRLSGLVHLKGRSLTAILIKGRDTAVIHAGAGILQSQPDLPVLLGMRRAGGRFGVDAGDRNRHSLILVIDKRHSHGQCAIGAGLDDVGILPGGSYQKPGCRPLLHRRC